MRASITYIIPGGTLHKSKPRVTFCVRVHLGRGSESIPPRVGKVLGSWINKRFRFDRIEIHQPLEPCVILRMFHLEI
jgi:hypothetical protein